MSQAVMSHHILNEIFIFCQNMQNIDKLRTLYKGLLHVVDMFLIKDMHSSYDEQCQIPQHHRKQLCLTAMAALD